MRFFQRKHKEGKYSDQDLLVMIRAGGTDERRALADLYQGLQPRVVSWVRKNGGTQADGEDAFQSAMMAFYDYLAGDRFGGECKLRAFLWQTSRRAWLMQCRRQGKELLLSEDTDPPDDWLETMMRDLLNDEANREEILLMISRACSSCAACRELLELQFYEGYSNEALADHFGHQENSVKVRRSKCLAIIREYLRAHPEQVELLTVPAFPVHFQ